MEWRTVKDFPNYEVSEDGQIRSKYTNKVMKLQTDICGYQVVNIYHEKKRFYRRIHRLIAEVFILNPNNLPQVNHIDGDKKCNYVWNLEWITPQDNTTHSIDTGLRNQNKAVMQYDKDGNFIREYPSATLAAKHIGCHKSTMWNACRGVVKTALGYVWRYKEC